MEWERADFARLLRVAGRRLGGDEAAWERFLARLPEPVRRRLEEFMAAQHGLPQDLRITDLGRHDEAHR